MLHVGNYHPFPFCGWVRATIDTPPVAPAWRAWDAANRHSVLVVDAGEVSPGVREVDCFLDLPGSTLVDASGHTMPEPFVRAPLPADVLGTYGVPMVGGVPLGFVSAEPSGAGYVVHLRAKVARMLWADLDLVVYPGQPWLAGELTLTASDPTVPDRTATVAGLVLTVSGGIVVGNPEWTTLGPTLGNGQRLVFPVVVLYPRRLSGADWASAAVAATHGAQVLGAAPWPAGWPRMPERVVGGFAAGKWTRERFAAAVAALQTWEPVPGIGPNKRSGDTGAQGDQIFVGGESKTLAGLGAHLVRYFTACMQGRRPCNHVEADGRPLDIDAHPDLRLWDGQVHWHTGVSPDRLGKLGPIGEGLTHGWSGPDVEHAYLDNLAVACRQTGRRGVHRLLDALARVYLFQWTTTPGVATSQAYAARAIGIEGLNAALFWRTLRDRALAERVRRHWLARWETILSPATAADLWDVRTDDPRLGAGDWWMPWQQALGAYGLDLAGETFGVGAARAAALRAARRVVAEGWRRDGPMGRWQTAPVRPVVESLGDAPLDFAAARRWAHEDTGVPAPLTDAPPMFDESFNLFGMPLAPAVLLRQDPTHPTALAIYEQLVEDAGGGNPWFPPEVVRG